MRKNDLNDRDDPTNTKSRTESDEPILFIPYTDIEDPTRKKVRMDNAEPRLAKSKTERDEPKRDNP
jgi:hypothetical protein